MPRANQAEKNNDDQEGWDPETPIQGHVRFTRALNEALAASEMSQSALAGELGVASSTVSNWVTGTKEPRPDRVFAIERCLGLREGELSRHLGYLPITAGWSEVSVESALKADQRLTSEFRRALLTMYREAVRVTGGMERRGPDD